MQTNSIIIMIEQLMTILNTGNDTHITVEVASCYFLFYSFSFFQLFVLYWASQMA